ncbi:MAG: MarC family protein [Verrucomicrobia bacterium]|nr:MarC family protein [Verrucomicrobiota bacterium]
MGLLEYSLLALSSLFVIVDPLATVPLFLAMTPRDSPATRERMARLACLTAGGVLLAFVLAGPFVFRLLGLTLPAFQIAGSVILLLVALDMLHARPSRVQVTPEETDEGTEKEDVAITPLGVPMLAGPGAISTTLILLNEATGFRQQVALVLAVLVVCFTSYWILQLGARSARWIRPIALRILSRLMGLLLAAIAVQFFLNALQSLGVLNLATPGSP